MTIKSSDRVADNTLLEAFAYMEEYFPLDPAKLGRTSSEE